MRRSGLLHVGVITFNPVVSMQEGSFNHHA